MVKHLGDGTTILYSNDGQTTINSGQWKELVEGVGDHWVKKLSPYTRLPNPVPAVCAPRNTLGLAPDTIQGILKQIRAEVYGDEKAYNAVRGHVIMALRLTYNAL